MAGMTLRPYQTDLVADVDQAFGAGAKSVLAVLATGGGKTMVASKICLNYKKVVWAAHRSELLDQAEKALKAVGHNNFTIQSVYSKSKVDDCDLLILDESHHEPAVTIRGFMERVKYNRVLGLTATPNRLDNQLLPFNTVLYGASLDELVEAKYLVPVHLYNVRAGRSTAVSLIEWMYEHPSFMKKCIVFARDKTEGKLYARALSQAYSTAEVYGDSDRTQILQDYQHGDIDVLISCAVLTEGTDLPCTSTIVLARNTESDTLLRQMVGRGVRLHSNKTHCRVIQPVTLDRKSRSIVDVITPAAHFVSSYRNGIWNTVGLK